LIPLALDSIPIWLEVLVFRQRPSAAMRAIGIVPRAAPPRAAPPRAAPPRAAPPRAAPRWRCGGFPVALIYVVPLFAFFPVLAAATGRPLSIQDNWLGLTAGAILNNGLNEETMMRGFVFRRLRIERSFWRAAALSTAYFAAYHLPLIATAGLMIGAIRVMIAIPIGLLTAYVYERGEHTIWASALVHAGTNAPAFLFTVADLQPVATPVYLLTSVALASAIMAVAFRRDRRAAGHHPNS
jgi:membrane protease YdiL (CAAX protease family)